MHDTHLYSAKVNSRLLQLYHVLNKVSTFGNDPTLIVYKSVLRSVMMCVPQPLGGSAAETHVSEQQFQTAFWGHLAIRQYAGEQAGVSLITECDGSKKRSRSISR
jgi:hypothetical protein